MKTKLKLLLLSSLYCLLFQLTARADFLGISNDTNFLASTNWTIALAPSYAPGLKNAAGEKAEWGVSAALLYPVTDKILDGLYAGVRGDYLADELWLPWVNVSVDKHFRLFRKADGTGGIAGTAYLVTGAGVPVGSDTSTSLSFIAGGGINLNLITRKSWRWGIGGESEYWTEPLDTIVYHAVTTFNWSF